MLERRKNTLSAQWDPNVFANIKWPSTCKISIVPSRSGVIQISEKKATVPHSTDCHRRWEKERERERETNLFFSFCLFTEMARMRIVWPTKVLKVSKTQEMAGRRATVSEWGWDEGLWRQTLMRGQRRKVPIWEEKRGWVAQCPCEGADLYPLPPAPAFSGRIVNM